MDIDHSGPSTNGPSATATDDAVVDGVLTELNDVLAQLEQKPTNIPLLRSQIRLLQQLGMAQEALDVILQLASLCALNEGKPSAHTRVLLIPCRLVALLP